MQFLKTLFWVLLAVFIALFASRNWSDVTLNLWGDIQVDIKIPVLLAVMVLIGFLPTFILQRARLWAVKRRLEAQERQLATASSPTAPPQAEDSPVI
jgi:lipopolysaccharide assembly protein A